MRLYLKVRFQEKEEVKALGARWDAEKKLWYVDDLKNITKLKKWMEVPEPEIMCEKLYVLSLEKDCWFERCNKKTTAICLATDLSYSKEEQYGRNTDLKLLSYVTRMPKSLADKLSEEFGYTPSFSRTVGFKYFMNHCNTCKKIQGDFYLHEDITTSFYACLYYKDIRPPYCITVDNDSLVPLVCDFPDYDGLSSSLEEHLLHVLSGKENYASMELNQRKANGLKEKWEYRGNFSLSVLNKDKF